MIKLHVLGRGYIYLLCTVCGYNVVADRIFTRLFDCYPKATERNISEAQA